MRPSLLSLLGFALLFPAACGGDDEQRGGPSSGNDAIERPDSPEDDARHGLSAEQAAEVLVRIGEREITVGQFADQLAAQSPYLRARYSNPQQRRAYLDNLVRFELLAAEAERRGLDDLPEVRKSREQIMVQQMMKDLFEDRIRLSDVSDEAIQSYYAEHRRDFEQPEQVRVSHIQVRDRALAEQILTQAREAEDDIEAWRALVDRYNEDQATGGARQGDLRFFSADGSRNDEPHDADPAPVDPAIARASFSLERIGQVHPELVETAAGFHILKLFGRRAALNRTLVEAERPIRNLLWRQQRREAIEEFVAGLREQAHVEIDEAALSQVRLDVPPVAARATESPTTMEAPSTTEGAATMVETMEATEAASTMDAPEDESTP